MKLQYPFCLFHLLICFKFPLVYFIFCSTSSQVGKFSIRTCSYVCLNRWMDTRVFACCMYVKMDGCRHECTYIGMFRLHCCIDQCIGVLIDVCMHVFTHGCMHVHIWRRFISQNWVLYSMQENSHTEGGKMSAHSAAVMGSIRIFGPRILVYIPRVLLEENTSIIIG